MSDATIIATIPKNKRETIRISLDRYANHDLADVRVVVEGKDGEPVLTKKGVSVRIEKLPALIEALRDAEAEARRRGLL